jgi:hypothetical protein
MYIEPSSATNQYIGKYEPLRYFGKDFMCGGGPDDGKLYRGGAWTVMVLGMSLQARSRCERVTLTHCWEHGTILMAINGFRNRYKGDVVLSKHSWHCCSKAEVELKSLGTGDLQA